MASQPLFVTYWLGYANHGITVQQVPEYIDVVNLFLVNLWPETALNTDYLTSGGMSWGAILDGVHAVQARGQKVLVSIMSTPHPGLSWNTIPDPARFASQVGELIDQWGVDGIDIDPEIGGGVPPNETFLHVVEELGKYFGPASGTGKMMSYVSYELPLDKTLLQQRHELFDHVSLMGYFWPYSEMIAQFNTYADIVGPGKLLFGVSPGGSGLTPLNEVIRLAKWQPGNGEAKGGMMEFNINGDTGFAYAKAIQENM